MHCYAHGKQYSQQTARFTVFSSLFHPEPLYQTSEESPSSQISLTDAFWKFLQCSVKLTKYGRDLTLKAAEKDAAEYRPIQARARYV